MESQTRGQKRASYMKEYREAHKEHLQELNRANYHQNKEARNAKRYEKFNCEICGGSYTHGHRKCHERTLLHQQAVSATTSGSSSSSPGAS